MNAYGFLLSEKSFLTTIYLDVNVLKSNRQLGLLPASGFIRSASGVHMTWQPSASLDSLKARAEFYRYIRDFFALRDVLEVETPALSQAGVSDPYLSPVQASCMGQAAYLHTSPEYPMKRLLAAGSGDIYQICKVFRDGECGRRHNPEFSMLEYYRLGFSLLSLMDEVAQLVGDYLGIQARMDLSYGEAVRRYSGLDPFSASDESLLQQARDCAGDPELMLDRDGCLDLIMTHLVEPNLPKHTLVFIHSYPQSQAALAKVAENHDGYAVAKRFELYVNSLELANGYDELSQSHEQRGRCEKDLALQAQLNGHARPLDERFLAAIEHGLPDCSGVALGLDRILMLKLNASHLEQVLAFPYPLS